MKPTMLTSTSLVYVLLPLAIALVAFYIFVYSREARQAKQLARSQKLMLRTLRLVVALLAVAAIARPAGVFQCAPSTRPAARERREAHAL